MKGTLPLPRRIAIFHPSNISNNPSIILKIPTAGEAPLGLQAHFRTFFFLIPP